MKGEWLLLKTLLRSTSRRNILRYSKDKKKKSRIRGGIIGMAAVIVMIMAYSLLLCVGYGMAGQIEIVPVMCGLTVCALAFVFPLFKTNGYLFRFKEYDMLMALPFSTKTVAASRFLYMYINSLHWYLCPSIAMMIGYGIFARPPVWVYLLWILLSFFLPVIPMLLATFVGFLIARISAPFKKTNIVQTILLFVFTIFCFSLRFIIDAFFQKHEVEATLEQAAAVAKNTARWIFPAGWFAASITKRSLGNALLLVVVSLALFLLVFRLVGASYRKLNSALQSQTASRNYRMKKQKEHSPIGAIVFKEYKRMTASSLYTMNCAMGAVLAVLLGVITLVFGFDRIVGIVTSNAPIDTTMLQPAIPFLIYFFIGMLATTVCSPSLEGKQAWIVRSLPIESKTLCQGKMLFNMVLNVPFMLFGILCLCISAHAPLRNTILYLLLGVALCAFSTTWGCVCGLKHMRLDWENEVEVIKQGAAVLIYLLPNLFATMALVVLIVFLGMRMDHALLTVVLILIVTILAWLSYRRAIALSERAFAEA